MRIGNVIRTARANIGITQNELANELHVTQQAVCKWENGNSYPDVTLCLLISNVLEIPLNVLLSGQGDVGIHPDQCRDLIYRCMSAAGTVVRVCDLLDCWHQDDMIQHEKDEAELKRRGVDTSSSVISLWDIDPFDVAIETSIQRHEEFSEMIKKESKYYMTYAAMMQYLGQDLSNGMEGISDETDPEFQKRLCSALIMNRKDYYNISNPFYSFEEKRPEIVAMWLRKGFRKVAAAV